jgi:hypothetical protein
LEEVQADEVEAVEEMRVGGINHRPETNLEVVNTETALLVKLQETTE